MVKIYDVTYKAKDEKNGASLCAGAYLARSPAGAIVQAAKHMTDETEVLEVKAELRKGQK